MSENHTDTAESGNLANKESLEVLAREYYSVKRAELTLTPEDIENIVENAKGRLSRLTAAAVEQLAHLMEHADSDAVRWNVTKYVLDHNLFAGDKSEDELDKLLRDLTRDNAKT